MNEKRTDVKLGFGKQLGFALGETAGQFFFGYWGTFLSIFYTDVVGIMPMAVSIIFIVARIWDAVNDPIMGNIADRHRHKNMDVTGHGFCMARRFLQFWEFWYGMFRKQIRRR